jgi:integrase/recombinase XerD
MDQATLRRNEIVPVAAKPADLSSRQSVLPELVERAGGAARFAWDEFFYAEHHNPLRCQAASC